MGPNGHQHGAVTGRRCKAKSQRTGEQCKQLAMVGMEVCRFHGGATPCGPRLPQFKHGRYSKAIPKELRQAYQRAEADAELLSLKADVAWMEARQQQLFEAMSDAAAPPWGQAVEALNNWKLAKTDDKKTAALA